MALPDEGEGRMIRDSVPDLIMLQAVWFALQHMDELDPEQRAVGLDRAHVLIDRHASALRDRWAGRSMPEQLEELVRDARNQLRTVESP